MSEFQVLAEDRSYVIELYNESVLASKIAEYFARPEAQRDAVLFLRAMCFALGDEDEGEEELPPLTEIFGLMAKIEPKYIGLNLSEFVEEFALNGQIKRL